MVIISYDIFDNKKRTKFSRYIRKFGVMMQYSVYQIENSDKILNNIIADLNNRFLKTFDQTDSVYIFKLNDYCEVQKFGYAKNDDFDLLIVN